MAWTLTHRIAAIRPLIFSHTLPADRASRVVGTGAISS
jgi:hypothetical protein